MPKAQIDQIDRKILTRLQKDGRIANNDLAEAVGLSPSPCLRRVKALEESGVVRTYVALVDPAMVELPVNVFVSVTLGGFKFRNEHHLCSGSRRGECRGNAGS